MFGAVCKICLEKDKAIELLKAEVAHLRELTRPKPIDNRYYPVSDQEQDLVNRISDDQGVEALTEEELNAQAEAVRILTGNY